MSGIALVKNLEMGTKKNEKRLEFGWMDGKCKTGVKKEKQTTQLPPLFPDMYIYLLFIW